MRTLQRIALILVIIGAVNWGLIGFFSFDLVASIFGGQDPFLSRVIYSLVGLSGLVCLTLFIPWDESDENASNQNQLNLGTEFGEEEDFNDFDKYKEDFPEIGRYDKYYDK